MEAKATGARRSGATGKGRVSIAGNQVTTPEGALIKNKKLPATPCKARAKDTAPGAKDVFIVVGLGISTEVARAKGKAKAKANDGTVAVGDPATTEDAIQYKTATNGNTIGTATKSHYNIGN